MSLSAGLRDSQISRYEAGPLRLRGALSLVPDGAVKWRPAPGKWSAHEIVCHCADAEVNAAARVRYLLAEKEPVIVAYDQDEWSRRFDYHALPLDGALATVLGVRAHTTALLKLLPQEAWTKEGRHTELGRYTMEDWLRIYADHLETHARQIERNVEAWRARTD